MIACLHVSAPQLAASVQRRKHCALFLRVAPRFSFRFATLRTPQECPYPEVVIPDVTRLGPGCMPSELPSWASNSTTMLLLGRFLSTASGVGLAAAFGRVWASTVADPLAIGAHDEQVLVRFCFSIVQGRP